MTFSCTQQAPNADLQYREEFFWDKTVVAHLDDAI